MAAALLTAWSQVSVPVQVQGWRKSTRVWRDSISDCASSSGSERRTRGWGPAGVRGSPELWLRCWNGSLSLSHLFCYTRLLCYCPPAKATLGRLSRFTIRREGGPHSGQRVGGRGVALLLELSCPSRASRPALESGCFVLFQMPVTFEDVALYLSREEWGRLDHAQQNFYRDVLQKRNGLSLGKGPRLCRGGHFPRPDARTGAIPPSSPSLGLKLLLVHLGHSVL